MVNLEELFKENGYRLTAFPGDHHSFYFCLLEAMKKGENVTQRDTRMMRNTLFEFEKENSLYFSLFLPISGIPFDGTFSSEDSLKRDLVNIKREEKPPTPREVFAAAEMLERYFYIIQYDYKVGKDIQKLKGYVFAPTNKQVGDTETVCLLMLERSNKSIEFSTISRLDNEKDLKSFPGVMVNKDHKHCFGLRFVNKFLTLFDNSVAYGVQPSVKDFYRRLSLEFYGTELCHDQIQKIICDFELEEDNLDMFCKHADYTITEETSLNDKRKILKTHIEKIRKRIKPPSEGEFFAVSSVYNVNIIIDKTGKDEWELYTPVVCSSFLSCFESPIILSTNTGQKDFTPCVTKSNTCSCRQQIPKIQGQIGKVKANIYMTVLKNPCCPSVTLKQNHTHLKHVPNVRTCWPEQRDYLVQTESIKKVIARLENEDRRLDQIDKGKGTLRMALAKELYGDEKRYLPRELQDVLESEDLQLKEKLQWLSNWLKVPIYIYQGVKDQNDIRNYCWTRYEPNENVFITKPDCRFYITLFENGSNDKFDRIIPLKGCNCQIPPPLPLYRNTHCAETEDLTYVSKKGRHHPLINFLTKDPDMNKFEKEIRDFPVCPAFSALRIALQRPDMEERTLDAVEVKRHSLLRCLSKEIFGTENNVDLLMEELVNELSNNFEQYELSIKETFEKTLRNTVGNVFGNIKGNKNRAKFVKERIEDDLPCGDLVLLLACNFFQTTIYVLRIINTINSTKSIWSEYKMGTKRRRELRKRTSFPKKCSQTRPFYITLLQTGSEQFCRIVPKKASCNCVLHAPTTPNCLRDSSVMFFQDLQLVRQFRNVDSHLNTVSILIDHWMYCNRNLQEHCEFIIQEIENRRRNVNIATITGTSAGIFGTVLTGIGVLLAPATGGISTLLTVGGALLAVSGGTVATGTKITESVLNNGTIDTLRRYQNCYKERFDQLRSELAELKKELDTLSDISEKLKSNQNIESSDFADVQSIPGIVRAVKGLIMIPIGVLKVSARGLTILGAVIGPLSALIDAWLLIFSAVNMVEGNKTDVTENLRRISASLYGSRRQMHCWAYGNQRSYHYDEENSKKCNEIPAMSPRMSPLRDVILTT